jgi:DNA-binding MarR family transcriptional regulator
VLTRAYGAVHRQFLSDFESLELSPTRLATLSVIVTAPGPTQSSIAKDLGIDRSAVVAPIDDLERRGLVERRALPESRRAYALHATNAGEAFYDRAIEHLYRFEGKAFSVLTAQEKRELTQLLAKIADAAGEPQATEPQE